MPKTVNVYTLEELKDAHPEVFAKIHDRWASVIAQSGDVPWEYETMESLRAVVGACGGTIREFSIGPDGPNSLSVDVEDEYEYHEESGNTYTPRAKDSDWLLAEVLAPLGYIKDGKAYFPGLCVWTGFCADDDFIEAVYLALEAGSFLTEALESLANKAGEMMRWNLDEMQSEESMLANWGHLYFTADGTEVR